MEKNKEISLSTAHNVKFPTLGKKRGNILILGNFDGVIGDDTAKSFSDITPNEATCNNLSLLVNAIKSGKKVWIVGNEKTIKYFDTILTIVSNEGVFESKAEFAFREKFHAKRNYTKIKNNVKRVVTDFTDWDSVYKEMNEKNMKFDTIIQNPPYSGSFHLDFLEKGADLLNENGKMVIVEPATWLINIRKFGKKGERGKTASVDIKKYDAIKRRLEGHIESVVIENLNKEFGTGLYVPFATTTIDMSKTYDTIDCIICGEHKIVESIYDINLIGKYDSIWSILEKVQKYGNMMNNHITKEDKGRDYWYTKYAELVCGKGGTLCTIAEEHFRDYNFINSKNGEYCINYITSAFHTTRNEISTTLGCTCKTNGESTNKPTDNIYGTKTELENWKHFIFNNKLPLFINIVMTIDQHNNSKQFLPWLVDKQYTDDEINEMFGFTDEEIKLIDTTIKKYERNSPWFKRYMCGKESVTDEEVNNFIAEISM